MDERGLAHSPLRIDKESFTIFHGPDEVGQLILTVTKGVFTYNATILKRIDHVTHLA
jgi:hypothetical protein